LNVVPDRYKSLNLSALGTYFAMARGYQGEQGDVTALPMKKWFRTNYHYLVPEISDTTAISMTGTKPFVEYQEAEKLGITTKPVIIGAYTFIKLARIRGNKSVEDFVPDLITAYKAIIHQFDQLGALWIQFDEPALVMDLSDYDRHLMSMIYRGILAFKGNCRVLLQTYFGDIRDCYKDLLSLSFDAIGLDFVEGDQSLALIKRYGFPEGKTLFAGLVNGKNIWKNDYDQTRSLITEISRYCHDVVINTSCSLLHVPYSLKNEKNLPIDSKGLFAFAEEKLAELHHLKLLMSDYHPDADAIKRKRESKKICRGCSNDIDIQKTLSQLSEDDYIRKPDYDTRRIIQKNHLKLPVLPVTTIGSFPQSRDVQRVRSAFKKGKIDKAKYDDYIHHLVADCIAVQEEIGLDVLVHGEFERDDMVAFFAEKLNGFLLTDNGWVQSYGTRCVKPPLIWGDVSRSKPMTVDDIVYAQSLSRKPVKGMLTGPVTLLNWSFNREDIPLKTIALQIALAIRTEVLDLEDAGISIIQIDEAAFREKLPLRKRDWHREYLEWAISAFRLVHSGVLPTTQIHTHMCYSEFEDIIGDIERMDADVFSFESSRSDLSIVQALKRSGFQSDVGPGLYDIHSPRVPGVAEMKQVLMKILDIIPIEQVWANPDCGLKTRELQETLLSLKNLVLAVGEVRRQKEVLK
ncbi:MAG: 5-methyltetrahydropteroyltriglutamate--homocysteine S-methyltransferase, partial [Eubacteriales bacterium]|nr:5-methyltetrahydropteroyltriglutamate--homocysteine S-methyltransferase [Eubacteriales bacterium]